MDAERQTRSVVLIPSRTLDTAAHAALTGVGPFGQPVHVRIIGYYMLNVAFTCVLWSVHFYFCFTAANWLTD